MVLSNRPFKKLKTRVTADEHHDFATFLSGDLTTTGLQPFRTAIKSFLDRYARTPYAPPLFASLVTGQIVFRYGTTAEDAMVMDVVEEDVTRSRSVYCNQCRVVGWSGHPVCNKRYHFMIKTNSSSGIGAVEQEYHKPCASCGNFVHLLDQSCGACGAMVMADEHQNLAYRQFEDSNYLLHGVIHSNGYGHLLTLNGREGGSKSVSGSDMMSFWDRLCKALFVRKVSVMDLSKKYGLECRLLHMVSHGQTWYGNWGYEFGAGCYGIDKETYLQAAESLSNMPLSVFFFNRRQIPSHLQSVIGFYQSLSDSKIVTFRDLFSLLLRLIRAANPVTTVKLGTASAVFDWRDDDVERVQRGMLKVLLAKKPSSSWVSRRDLKGAMFKSGSSELLDYCLKHLDGTLSPTGTVVKARHSLDSEAVDFRLEKAGSWHDPFVNPNPPSREQLIKDLRFLHDTILDPKTMEHYISQERMDTVTGLVTKLLDCKQFVKDYKPESVGLRSPGSIFMWCHGELVKGTYDNPAPPPELIILPQTATVSDLKREAAEAFEEVYTMFKKFLVIELLEFRQADDTMTLQLLVGTSGVIRIRGRCNKKYGLSSFRTEKGLDKWIVNCVCGTIDDDGEPMLACDTCGIWQHTRCAGVASSDDIPEKFTCLTCATRENHDKFEVPEKDLNGIHPPETNYQ